jgi:hypothetical protein
MVAWLLVCVSEAEQRGGRKGLGAEVLEKKRKKEVEKYITGEKKKKVGLGTRRIGLNGYPLKQAGRGFKRVFKTGRGGAGQNPTHSAPLPSLVTISGMVGGQSSNQISELYWPHTNFASF